MIDEKKIRAKLELCLMNEEKYGSNGRLVTGLTEFSCSKIGDSTIVDVNAAVKMVTAKHIGNITSVFRITQEAIRIRPYTKEALHINFAYPAFDDFVQEVKQSG